MNKRGRTKDEFFLLTLYEVALKTGDVHAEIDRYVIGKLIGQNDKGLDVIVRNLAQTNFIKKGDGNAVYLTSNGLRFIEEEI
jgi:hypothetical protein